MADWHTADSARAQWSDAPGGTELSDLLELAKDACWRYVHPDDEEAPEGEIPVRFRVAQLAQAQAVWQLRRTSPGGDSIGLDGYQARVYVFGYDIQKILVPPVHGEMVG